MPAAEVTEMQMPKPTEADRERFAALAPDDPRVTVKPLFATSAPS